MKIESIKEEMEYLLSKGFMLMEEGEYYIKFHKEEISINIIFTHGKPEATNISIRFLGIDDNNVFFIDQLYQRRVAKTRAKNYYNQFTLKDKFNKLFEYFINNYDNITNIEYCIKSFVEEGKIKQDFEEAFNKLMGNRGYSLKYKQKEGDVYEKGEIWVQSFYGRLSDESDIGIRLYIPRKGVNEYFHVSKLIFADGKETLSKEEFFNLDNMDRLLVIFDYFKKNFSTLTDINYCKEKYSDLYKDTII